MHFTALFIHKPIYAIALSIALLLVGALSLKKLSVRDYPFTQDATVVVETQYTGADPALIASFVTSPLEAAVAQTNGIDYISSSSSQNASRISAKLKLNVDPSRALAQISANVNSVLNQLPAGTQQPIVTIESDSAVQAMVIGFSSPSMSSSQIADYVARVIQPRLQAIPGVQRANFFAQPTYAMRAWLDPYKMAALGVTANDVSNALTQNNYEAGIGTTQGKSISVNLTSNTGLHTVDDFKQLVIRSQNGALVRLSDVARVELGAQDYSWATEMDNHPAVFLEIRVAPTDNVVAVAGAVRKVFPSMVAEMPEGISGNIIYDESDYIGKSIDEVIRSLLESLAIVAIVVFVMIGSWRSVLVPIVAIPLSLIGTFAIMLVFGFTINLLTLLALVLAIGMVVDDAIIVLENVHRHIEHGMGRQEAAIAGVRELVRPVVSMTLVLVAVYAPIAFVGGLTGTLFAEFALTLVGAVTTSAVVALTLSPLMCATVLPANLEANSESRFSRLIDRTFSSVQAFYRRRLTFALRFPWAIVALALFATSAAWVLHDHADAELAPTEDEGIVMAQLTNQPSGTRDRMMQSVRQSVAASLALPETDHVFAFADQSGATLGIVARPWSERKRTTTQMQQDLQARFDGIPGAKAGVYLQPPFGDGSGFGLDIVVGTTEDFTQLNGVAQRILDKAKASGKFAYVGDDLRFDSPQESLEVDRDKAASLGVSMQDVGQAAGTMLSGGYVNYFSSGGRLYQVIPQVENDHRANTAQIGEYYIKSADGSPVQLGSIIHTHANVTPRSLSHYQQLNATIITVLPAPGVSEDQALATLREIAEHEMPQGYSLDYAGTARAFVRESSSLATTLVLAIAGIFLLLAVQFQSFRDAAIILVSVPVSIFGAMIFIAAGVGGATLNIYTQIGLVTLVGLVSKHGILLVEFANARQLAGASRREAVISAATTRLRPILMTSAAMTLGVLPLVLASGAGAEARFNLGLVMLTGVAIGSALTIFVVPAFYLLFAAEHHRQPVPRSADAATSPVASPISSAP